MFPLVSVIMSTYNRESFCKEALDSVFSQNYENFELIVINDNSQDNTKELLNSCNDKRLRIYQNKETCGCTFNYHNAQNLAKGKYIAHIDDDDIWLQDKLKHQIEYMETHPQVDILGTFIETFGENARPSWVFDTNADKIAFLMNFYNPICHSSIVYRKSFMLEKGINYDINKICSQDYDLYKQTVCAGGKIENLSEIFVRYRMHKIRLTDVKETQDIQIYNAENIKKELLQRFLNKDEIDEITSLTAGFPFNEYDYDKVIKAVDTAASKYKQAFSIENDIIEEIKNDIRKGIYSF